MQVKECLHFLSFPIEYMPLMLTVFLSNQKNKVSKNEIDSFSFMIVVIISDRLNFTWNANTSVMSAHVKDPSMGSNTNYLISAP